MVQPSSTLSRSLIGINSKQVPKLSIFLTSHTNFSSDILTVPHAKVKQGFHRIQIYSFCVNPPALSPSIPITMMIPQYNGVTHRTPAPISHPNWCIYICVCDNLLKLPLSLYIYTLTIVNPWGAPNIPPLHGQNILFPGILLVSHFCTLKYQKRQGFPTK